MPNAVERYLSNVPYLAVLRQAPWGFSAKRIVAQNPAVVTDFGDVWEVGENLAYLSAAVQLAVASDSADDAATGPGARTATLEGLDASYAPISETVTLDGTDSVTTALAFLRVNSFRVVSAGANGEAAGTIKAWESGNPSNVQAQISPEGTNISLASHFTVPANMTGYVVAIRYASDDQTTRFRLMARSPGDPFTARDAYQVGVDPFSPELTVPIEITEKSDVKITARRPTSQSALAIVSYDLILAPKTLAAIRSFGRPSV